MKYCDCKKWHENMTYLHLMEGHALGGKLKYLGDKFKYCPWCGHKLREDGVKYLGNII